MPIYTIGHSTHESERFVEIAHGAGVEVIVDIRSHRSSKWPQWRGERMDVWLPMFGFGSESAPGLGGWDVRHSEFRDWAAERGVRLDRYLRGFFPKDHISKKLKATGQLRLGEDPDRQSLWTSQGLHDYAWFTALPEFQTALEQLERDRRAVAILCSEVLWWKCHRQIVADALVARGTDVLHILPGSIKPHPLGTRLERYPREVLRAWGL